MALYSHIVLIVIHACTYGVTFIFPLPLSFLVVAKSVASEKLSDNNEELMRSEGSKSKK